MKPIRQPWRKFNWKRWEEVYQLWKSSNPELTKEQRATIRRGCLSKSAFPNFWEAMQGANAMRRDFETGDQAFGIYHCPICGGEHVGRNRFPGRTR